MSLSSQCPEGGPLQPLCHQVQASRRPFLHERRRAGGRDAAEGVQHGRDHGLHPAGPADHTGGAGPVPGRGRDPGAGGPGGPHGDGEAELWAQDQRAV